MTRAAVALGSNLGDRLGHLRAGLEGLGEIGTIVATSALYETSPVGGPPGQSRYLNAVVVVETSLAPLDLLAHLLTIEAHNGRVRTLRWGPRTLDLDLIAYEDQRIDLPTLEVPHPRAHERAFVLAPLCDVWPDVRLANGRSALDSWESFEGRAGLMRWEGDWVTEAPRLGRRAVVWVVAQFALFTIWLAVTVTTTRLELPEAVTVAGWVIAALGALLLLAAARHLGEELTPYPEPRRQPNLVDRGLYGHVRHPIYGGVLLLLLGASIGLSSPGGFVTAVVVIGFFTAKASLEERANAIGVPGYTEYLSRVRSRFLPMPGRRVDRAS